MSKPLSEVFQGYMTPEERLLKGYLLSALFMMEDDEDPRTKEVGVDDLAPETLEAVKADCNKFLKDNEELITDENILRRCSSVEESAGHDFYLTRHGAGAGFWDGDWAEEAGEKLTQASKKFRETHFYVGDDGKVYIM